MEGADLGVGYGGGGGGLIYLFRSAVPCDSGAFKKADLSVRTLGTGGGGESHKGISNFCTFFGMT